MESWGKLGPPRPIVMIFDRREWRNSKPFAGIFLQGKKIAHGHVFKQGSTIKVLPGFKRLGDLAPGAVYVELAGVTFEMPEKK